MHIHTQTSAVANLAESSVIARSVIVSSVIARSVIVSSVIVVSVITRLLGLQKESSQD